jgi:hypothetical protein
MRQQEAAMTEQNILDLPVDAMEDRQHQLISTRRVEGTSVYNLHGEKLGTVHSVMLEKQSGRAAYALMSFGGFLGVGEIAHPIPWEMLTYDEKRDGYIVDLSREQLDKAPAFRLDVSDRPRERTQEDAIYGYYGLSPWWPI